MTAQPAVRQARAQGQSYSWSIDDCPSGGSWLAPNCWNPENVPNSIDDAVNIGLDGPGVVAIPTSSILRVTVNNLTTSPEVTLAVGDNMALVLSRSTNGIDPGALLFGVLSVAAPDLGSAQFSLSGGTALSPVECHLDGSGDIRLGYNAGLSAGNYGKFILGGGLEVYATGSESQPSSILGDLTNDGGEVVVSGWLNLVGDITNQNGGFVEVDDVFGGTLMLSGSITGGTVYPGAGSVVLNGGRLAGLSLAAGNVRLASTGQLAGTMQLAEGTVVSVDATRTLDVTGMMGAGELFLTNDGVIRLGSAQTSGATLRCLGSLAQLEGTGRLVLEGAGSWLTAPGGGNYVNGPDHTIEGRGNVDALIQNQGHIVATGGELIFWSPLVHAGGDVLAQGDGPTNLGTVRVASSFHTGELRIGSHGRLVVENNRSVLLHGDYIIESQQESATGWGASTSLLMKGQSLSIGLVQNFEAASEDKGATTAGFSGNFQLRGFGVELADTYVLLRDMVDNGNRIAGSEAVYVSTLTVEPGATLNLNGICLYTMYQGAPYRVAHGDGPLFGGGEIIDATGTGVEEIPPVERVAELFPSWPNPFNPRTTLAFHLRAARHIELRIYDCRGRLITTLLDETRPAGRHELIWSGLDESGRQVASGTYLYELTVGSYVETRRMTLLK